VYRSVIESIFEVQPRRYTLLQHFSFTKCRI